LSDKFLPDIAEAAAKVVNGRQILDFLLPEQPEMIMAVAAKLYPNPSPDRQLFTERALAILKRPSVKSPSRNRLQGQLSFELGKVEEGIDAYREAIRREPRRIEWRLEFAKALHDAGKLDQAQRELRAVLGLQPDHGEARDLVDVIDRELQLREDR
jgi:predicted Zn-dependent protease